MEGRADGAGSVCGGKMEEGDEEGLRKREKQEHRGSNTLSQGCIKEGRARKCPNNGLNDARYEEGRERKKY